MFKVLIPAVAALGLIAFAAKTQPVVGEHMAPTDPIGWHLSKEGETAKLAFGVADSDSLAMLVTCAPGDTTAVVYGDVRPEVAKAETASVSMDETRVSVRGGALRDLADKGLLKVAGEDGAFQIAATESERRAIGQFLDYCGGKPA
jgi:hypothetical protein